MSKLLGHDMILSGDFLVETDRRLIRWVGRLTGTRTLNELYSALRDLFDNPEYMDESVPMLAIDRDTYQMINGWTIDDSTFGHLTSGTLLG